LENIEQAKVAAEVLKSIHQNFSTLRGAARASLAITRYFAGDPSALKSEYLDQPEESQK
jgi:hypothetical protein